MDHIVIIGNGIAGTTLARHIRKRSDHKITIISGESDYFFSRTALMYIYMGHMKFEHTKPYEDWFWSKNRIELKKAWVKSIDLNQKQIHFDTGEPMTYDKLVLATGSQSNKFGWPGQDLQGVQGLVSLQDLDLMEVNTKKINHAVVVGGGLIGIEMAEMLHSRHIPVTYLVREANFWGAVLPKEEAQLIDNHIKENGIDLRLKTELKEIVDDGKGKVKAVVTTTGETIPCEFVGLTVGVHPNIDLAKPTAIETDRGILVDEFLSTSVNDVFAIGDCAQLRYPLPGRKSIEAVWYVGRMMGEILAQTLTGNQTAYQPGIWFNSAKFFDIEYQTYGTVKASCDAGEAYFYWECSDKRKCIKIIYDEANFKLKGINSFGIRMRHEVWDQWLREERRLDYIIENLKKANFDPEFFRQYDPEIQQKFNDEFPFMTVKVRRRSLWEKLMQA